MRLPSPDESALRVTNAPCAFTRLAASQPARMQVGNRRLVIEPTPQVP